MNKIFASVLAISAIVGLASSASSQSLYDYHEKVMESKCAKAGNGAKWLGGIAGLSSVPGAGLLSAFATEDCDQWNIYKAERDQLKFEQENPDIVREYNTKYGIVPESATNKSWQTEVFASKN